MTDVFAKLATDVALYQMYASMVLAVACKEGPHGGGMLFLLAASLLLAFAQTVPALRKGPRRAAPVAAAALLLVLEFFTSASAAQKAAFVPPAVYLLVMGAIRTWQVDYEEQRGRFLTGFWGLALFPVLLLFGRAQLVPALSCVLPWILVYLVCGVLQLRLLREAGGGRGLARRLGEIVALFAFCLLLERTGAFARFLDGLAALWSDALRPGLIALLGGILYVPLLLAERLVGWLQGLAGDSGAQGAEALHGFRTELYTDLGYQMEQWRPISEKTAAVWTAVFAAAGLLLLLVLFRRLAGRRLQGKRADGIEEIREAIDAPDDRRRRDAVCAPAEGICQLFARYVALLQKKGGQPRDSDTSRQLADQGKERMSGCAEEIEQLRSLYLPARYRDGSPCSRTEWREAARLWRKIRRKAGAKKHESRENQ